MNTKLLPGIRMKLQPSLRRYIHRGPYRQYRFYLNEDGDRIGASESKMLIDGKPHKTHQAGLVEWSSHFAGRSVVDDCHGGKYTG